MGRHGTQEIALGETDEDTGAARPDTFALDAVEDLVDPVLLQGEQSA